MKSLMTLFFVLFSINSFAASLGESMKPGECVATAADKARAAKEFIAATSSDDKKKEVKTIEK